MKANSVCSRLFSAGYLIINALTTTVSQPNLSVPLSRLTVMACRAYHSSHEWSARAKPEGSKGNATGGPNSGALIAADPATVERIGILDHWREGLSMILKANFPSGKPLKWRCNESGWTPLEICESSAFTSRNLREGEGTPDRPLAGQSASQETCHS